LRTAECGLRIGRKTVVVVCSADFPLDKLGAMRDVEWQVGFTG